MTQQIIRLLLETQGFTSSEHISNVLKQPLSIINRQIMELHQKYPGLLIIKENNDRVTAHLYIKIAPYGDSIANSLI